MGTRFSILRHILWNLQTIKEFQSDDIFVLFVWLMQAKSVVENRPGLCICIRSMEPKPSKRINSRRNISKEHFTFTIAKSMTRRKSVDRKILSDAFLSYVHHEMLPIVSNNRNHDNNRENDIVIEHDLNYVC